MGSKERHPSSPALTLVTDEPVELAPVVAHFDGEGTVVHYVFGDGDHEARMLHHRHDDEELKRWLITHEYDADLEATVCTRTPVTTN